MPSIRGCTRSMLGRYADVWRKKSADWIVPKYGTRSRKIRRRSTISLASGAIGLLQEDVLIMPCEKIASRSFCLEDGHGDSSAAHRVVASAILIVVSQSIADFEVVLGRNC